MKAKNVASQPLDQIREESAAISGTVTAIPTVEDRDSVPIETDPPEVHIRELAFRLYEERGRVDGFDVQDWLEAESIIRNHGKIAA